MRDGVIASVANVSAWTTAYTVTAVPRPGDLLGGLCLVLDGLDPGRLGARCEAEFQLADFLACLRGGIGDHITSPRVAFAHPAPRDTGTHSDYFGPGLAFDAPHTEIVYPAEVLDVPVSTARPGLAGVLAGHLAALRAPGVPATYALRVREWLLERLVAGEPGTVSAAARALTVSERTLHRRLADEATTFRAVREATRRQFAVDLVRRSPRTLKEIASLVGFADSRSFHRAYLRWTGSTPGRDRRTGG